MWVFARVSIGLDSSLALTCGDRSFAECWKMFSRNFGEVARCRSLLIQYVGVCERAFVRVGVYEWDVYEFS